MSASFCAGGKRATRRRTWRFWGLPGNPERNSCARCKRITQDYNADAYPKRPERGEDSRVILFFASVWLLPLVGLFALGHAVGWIIRGFRDAKLAAKADS